MMATSENDHERQNARARDNGATVLTPELREFYDRHNLVGIEEFLKQHKGKANASCRFIRFNPRFDERETLSLLQSELSSRRSAPIPVAWLDESLAFYAVPGDFGLAQSASFRSGRIYGMDVSSGAAVAALLSDHHDRDAAGGESNRDSKVETCQESTSKDASNGKGSTIPGVVDDTTSCGETHSDGLRVLDLCCSPGLKLCTIADLLSFHHEESIVVGVDISENRIALCKNIVKKYHIDKETSGRSHMGEVGGANKCAEAPGSVRIRLYHNDGTSFGTFPDQNLVFDSTVATEEHQHAGKRKRMNKSARARERKRLRQIAELDMVQPIPVVGENNPKNEVPSRASGGETAMSSVNIHLFDRVLVDAECSTDGSLKHVQQSIIKNTLPSAEASSVESESAGFPTVDISKLTDASQLKKLVQLQRKLINSGLRLLKPGGVMVYSTCSLSNDQNEDVVSWLLEQYPRDVTLVPLSFSKEHHSLIVEGSLPGTIRFLPGLKSSSSLIGSDDALYGGGFFLAKLRKSDANSNLCGNTR